MKTVGTVLPTKKSLKLTEEFFRQKQNNIAIAEAKLNGIKRIVAGEKRWYQNASQYIIVGSDAKGRLFETRADGEYFISYIEEN